MLPQLLKMSAEPVVRDYNAILSKVFPPGFKELMKTIQGLIRLNRVPIFWGGVYLWGEGGFCCNPDIGCTKSIVQAAVCV